MLLNPQQIVRDVVVLGASAGGVEAVLSLVRLLSPDIPAVLALVVHRAPQPSRLAEVFARRAPIRVREAAPGEPATRGCLYLAPPDRHLVFAEGGLETVAGAKEHSTRPAIDPLFASAARLHGERVVGIILSGSGTDGTRGLRAIERAGGVALVQDPREAAVPSMVLSAIAGANPDASLTVAEIAAALGEMARGHAYASAGDPGSLSASSLKG